MKLNKQDGVFILPDADHVEGIALLKAEDWRLSVVEIQYRNARAGWCKLSMTLPNALYLLNLLEDMNKSNGYEARRKGLSG